MQLLNYLGLLALLSVSTHAVEITIFDNVEDCNRNEETTSRKLTFDAGTCYTFNQKMDGVACEQIGPNDERPGCVTGPLDPKSISWKDEGIRCDFFVAENCGGMLRIEADVCVKAQRESEETQIKSFKCYKNLNVEPTSRPLSSRAEPTAVPIPFRG